MSSFSMSFFSSKYTKIALIQTSPLKESKKVNAGKYGNHEGDIHVNHNQTFLNDILLPGYFAYMKLSSMCMLNITRYYFFSIIIGPFHKFEYINSRILLFKGHKAKNRSSKRVK